MNGLRDLARRHPVSTFYVLTLLYSWTLWALMLASARGWLPFPFATNWTGSFGPAAGAVVTAFLLGGRAEVDRLLRPIGRWRFGRALWLFVLAGSMVPFFSGLLAYVIGHGRTGGTAETLANLPLLALYYPVVFVLGGPLGEEIGWRGFALPRLVDRHGPALASLLVAAGWLAWHLPLFWLEGAAQKGGSLVLFALAVLALSFLFTGVFLESGGSLLAVLLLHAGINAPSLLVPPGATFQDDPVAKGVELGLWLGLAGSALLFRRRRFFSPGGGEAAAVSSPPQAPHHTTGGVMADRVPPLRPSGPLGGVTLESYLDSSGRADALSGGARMIPVETPVGTFRVFTKRVGNNPRVRLLLLHGGPGVTHEYFEACDSWLPAAGVEYYYYDQLGSFYSDQPAAPELWEIPRFVDEVDQVRKALGLGKENLFLLGQSWGGILAIEYALRHQEHLRGLIVSNMMASIPAYNAYAKGVLMPAMDQAALAEIQRLEAEGKNEDPRYMELLVPHHYEHHVLRMPAAEWPEPVNRAFAHLNPAVYVPMQGPSELGASGKLVDWDRTADLASITVPTLVMGATHDTMDPAHLEGMAKSLPRGRYHHSPVGSHLAIYDDQASWFEGLLGFLRDVDSGAF